LLHSTDQLTDSSLLSTHIFTAQSSAVSELPSTSST